MSRFILNRQHDFPLAFSTGLILLCLIGGTGFAESEVIATTKTNTPALSDMIDELDNLSFDEREKAEKKIEALGPEILPELRKLHKSPNRFSLETKFRIKRIIRDLEKQKQFQLADRVGTKKLSDEEFQQIPGWKTFSETFDDTPETRQLFLKLYAAEPEIWYAIANSDRNALREIIDFRSFELQYGLLTGKRYDAPPISTLSILFAECRSDLQQMGVPQTWTTYSMAYSKSMREALADTNKDSKQYKKVVSHWITNGKTTPDYNRMYLALRYQLPAGRIPARNIIKQNPAHRNVQIAIFALAKFGDQKDVDLLLPLLKNKTVLSPTRIVDKSKPVFTVQVRDVALTALLVLNKQDPKSYGFSRLRTSSIYLYSQNSAGFMNDSDREKAFEKWRAWADKNLKTENTAQPDKSNA